MRRTAGHSRRGRLAAVLLLSVAVFCIAAHLATPARAQTTNGMKTSYKFDFGAGQAADGYTPVSPDTVYTKERGYGFDLGSKVTALQRSGTDALRASIITADRPFYLLRRAAGGKLPHHRYLRGCGGRIREHRQGRIAPPDAGNGADGVGEV